LSKKEIGLGVVNPRTDEVESSELIISRVEQALEYYRPEQIFLNPTSDLALMRIAVLTRKKLRCRKSGE